MSKRWSTALLCSLLGLACSPTEKNADTGETNAAAEESGAARDDAKVETKGTDERETVQAESADGGSKADGPAVDLPNGTFAVVTVPEPHKRIDELKALAEAVMPGAAAQIDPMLGELAAVDLSAPIHVLVVDPQVYKSPVVVVGKVSDAASLKAMMPGEVETRSAGDLTIFASADTATAVDPWIKDTLPKRAVPSSITADFDAALLREKYAQFKPMMMMGLNSQGPQAEAGKKMIEAMESFGAQVDRIQLRVELGHGRLDVVTVAGGKAGSTLQKLAQAQAKMDLPVELLRKLARDGDSVVGGAHMSEESRAFMGETMGTFISQTTSLPPEEAKAAMKLWAEIMGARVAFAGDMSSITDMKIAYAFEVTDEAKAMSFLETEWNKFFSKSYESMGISKFEGKGCAPDESALPGHKVVTCEGRTTFVKQPSGPKLPDQDVRLSATIDNGFMLMAMGEPSRLADVKKRLDGEAQAEPAWMGEATRRKEWGIMRMDLGRIAAAATGGAAPSAGGPTSIDMAMGSEGDALTLRLGTSANTIKSMMMLGSAAAGI